MRVSSQLPVIGSDAIADHAHAGNGGFRAALRAAGKADKAKRGADGELTAQPAPQIATAQAAPQIATAQAAPQIADPALALVDAATVTPTATATPAATAASAVVTPTSQPSAPKASAPPRTCGLATQRDGDIMPTTSTELVSVTTIAAISRLESASEPSGAAPVAHPPTRTGAGTGAPTGTIPVIDPLLALSAASAMAGATPAIAKPAGKSITIPAKPGAAIDALGATPKPTAVAAAPQATQVAATTPAAADTAPDTKPISAMIAAAGRALGLASAPAAATSSSQAASATSSLAGVSSTSPTSSASNSDATPVAAPTLTAMPSGLDATKAMTPLEQAVHDLIGRVAERDTAHIRSAKPTSDDADAAALAPFHLLAQTHLANAPQDPAAPAAPAASSAAPVKLPEPPANPSHVHLVVDDGPERTVVTVALRGNEVHIATRSTDDATTNALARNAASLDHALRARGLALGELQTEREPTDRRPPRDPEPRERREPDAEPFTLEETP